MNENFPSDDERDGRFWRRVYVAVVGFTVFVVTALWGFSKYFS
ncbi:MAG TPA: hypothetical protein PKD26_14500 [Pyrinomonadaceae bacterium]|nr:hypothetical protein [Pyrinomonadaceae bacterium]